MNRLPPDLRAFIDGVRNADGPRAEDRARIHQTLQHKLRSLGVAEVRPPLGTEALAAQNGAALALSSGGLRVVLITLAVGGLGTAALLWSADGGAPAVAGRPPPAASSQASSIGSQAASRARQPEVIGSQSTDSQVAVSDAAPSDSSSAARDEAPRVTGARLSRPATPAARRLRAGRFASRRAGAVAGPADPTPAPVVGAVAEAADPAGASAPRSGAAPSGESATSDADKSRGLSEEIALVGAARRALLNGDSSEALRQLAAHADRFANGRLSEERRGLQSLALCNQGRTAEALALRDRFLQQSPHSVLAAQVRRACGPSERTAP